MDTGTYAYSPVTMFSKFASVVALGSAAAAKILYAGVSESGGEFGVFSATATPGTGLPGEFGVQYAFINESTVDIFVDEEKVRTTERPAAYIILTGVHRLIFSVLRSYL